MHQHIKSQHSRTKNG